MGEETRYQNIVLNKDVEKQEVFIKERGKVDSI